MKKQSSCIIEASSKTESMNNPALTERVAETMSLNGYCLLRGYDVDLQKFSQLVQSHCSTVTFDPARSTSEQSIQKVDAGSEAIGLHVENGNTPRIPQLVAFYCAAAARKGSQTTLCDGATFLDNLDPSIKALLDQPVSVSRRLDEHHWKAYLVNEHPALSQPEQVTEQHLREMLQAYPGQEAELNRDGSLDYSVMISPLMKSQISNRAAFANALLGPSFNYQKPSYTFSDGSTVTEELKSFLASEAEKHTIEIDWQDGDIALIDNHRVMHGRRAISDTERRKLFIGMGDF